MWDGLGASGVEIKIGIKIEIRIKITIEIKKKMARCRQGGMGGGPSKQPARQIHLPQVIGGDAPARGWPQALTPWRHTL